MCGFVGVAAARGATPALSWEQLDAMANTLNARGPDGSGRSDRGNVLFAHRRLSVVGGEAGAQPMTSPDGRYGVVYNGELYNDAEVRLALTERGVVFKTRSDTETVLWAFAVFGPDAPRRLRGMYAVAFHDRLKDSLILSRDPLGVKPLFYSTAVRGELVFGSQLPALLAHPEIPRRPHLAALSAYLVTLRTTLGSKTLFEGIETVRPGETLTLDLRRPVSAVSPFALRMRWTEPSVEAMEPGEAAAAVRSAVEASVEAHLRSDVPRCALLSGGLDSGILTALLRQRGEADLMRTWCAGTPVGWPSVPLNGEPAGEDDLSHADALSGWLGTAHTRVELGRGQFRALWTELLEANALPLSTPNETAILAVSRALKPHATVAFSGEGADELFGGYVHPVFAALDGVRRVATLPETARARYTAELEEAYSTHELGGLVDHYLRVTSWVAPQLESEVLAPWATGGVAALRQELHDELADIGRASLGESVEDAEMEAMLRLHRRVNLTGLLGRLDSSTMAASVEGRTPFADVRVAELASRIPWRLKVDQSSHGPEVAARAVTGGALGKRVLREAFRDLLPAWTVDRPKVSFPLPFEGWLSADSDVLQRSHVVKEVFSPAIREHLIAPPKGLWRWSWPVINAARWLDRYF